MRAASQPASVRALTNSVGVAAVGVGLAPVGVGEVATEVADGGADRLCWSSVLKSMEVHGWRHSACLPWWALLCQRGEDVIQAGAWARFQTRIVRCDFDDERRPSGCSRAS